MKILNAAGEGLLQPGMGECSPSFIHLCGCRSQEELLFEDCELGLQKKQKISLKQKQSKLSRKHSLASVTQQQLPTSPKTMKNIANCNEFSAQGKITFSLKQIEEHRGDPFPSFAKATLTLTPTPPPKSSPLGSTPYVPAQKIGGSYKDEHEKVVFGCGESNTGRTSTESEILGALHNTVHSEQRWIERQPVMDSLIIGSPPSSPRNSTLPPQPPLSSCRLSASSGIQPKVCRSIIFGESGRDETESLFSQVLQDDGFSHIFFKTAFKRSTDAIQ